MKCYPKNDAILVDSVQKVENITILVVSLGGGEHWDMYQVYKNLPDVVTYDDQDFGKSAWNSDVGRAYYRSDYAIAFVK